MGRTHSKRYFPSEKRTQVLLRQLKNSLKSAKYKTIKADIRGLVQYGRQNPRIFEEKMNEINQMAVKKKVAADEGSDLLHFVSLIQRLNTLCEIDSIEENVSLKVSSIYLHQSVLEHAFSLNGSQVNPIELAIPKSKWYELNSIIENSEWEFCFDRSYKSNHILGTLSKTKRNNSPNLMSS
ncbi:DUF2913 family protein [Vibrio vulnificus]|uniref:DUF2913 family protein n=1 Tax=Vibrio vulnificus TaxID=672 RepID=UPI001029F4FC|nr:DUF2913 family protein [Vibrio vulnificus]RZP73099.1 DUF2913 family protein [Vibrio vulnificus]